MNLGLADVVEAAPSAGALTTMVDLGGLGDGTIHRVALSIFLTISAVEG
jgi:hypothetical protein